LEKTSSTLDSKVNEISKLNDKLNEKDEEIRSLNEKLANVSSSANDSTIDSLKEEIENLKKEKDELCSSLAELSQKEKASEYEVQRLNEELKVKEPKDESEDVDTDKLSQDLLSSLNLGDDNN
jgi:chromosome segregation ATPase